MYVILLMEDITFTVREPSYENGKDGGLNQCILILKEDTPPILLVDTTYANEGSSPIDKETGKHIQRKIEWQDPETRKCYRSIILQTW